MTTDLASMNPHDAEKLLFTTLHNYQCLEAPRVPINEQVFALISAWATCVHEGEPLVTMLSFWSDIIAGLWHGPSGTVPEYWISKRALRMWGYLGDAVAEAGGHLIVLPAILVMALIDDQSETLVTYEQWTDDGVRVSITAAGQEKLGLRGSIRLNGPLIEHDDYIDLFRELPSLYLSHFGKPKPSCPTEGHQGSAVPVVVAKLAKDHCRGLRGLSPHHVP